MKAFVALVCFSLCAVARAQSVSGSFQASANIPDPSAALQSLVQSGRYAVASGLQGMRDGVVGSLGTLNGMQSSLAGTKINLIKEGTQGLQTGMRQTATALGGIPFFGSFLSQGLNANADVAGTFGAGLQDAVGQMSAAKSNMITTAQGKVNDAFANMAAGIGAGLSAAGNMAAAGQHAASAGIGAGLTAAGNLATTGQQAASAGIGAGLTAAGNLAATGQQAASAGIGAGLSAAGNLAATGQQAASAGISAAGKMAATGQQAASAGLSAAGNLAATGQQAASAGLSGGLSAAGTVASGQQVAASGSGFWDRISSMLPSSISASGSASIQT